MSDTLRQLADCARDRVTRDGLVAQIEVARRQASESAHRCADANAALAGELADVEKLESMSMTRILAGLRGRRDTDLDRERAEAEAARYVAASEEARRVMAQREVDSLEARISEYADLDDRRRELLVQREAEVAADPAAASAAARLTEVASAMGALDAELVQLAEAEAAAHQVYGALSAASQHLESAASWSTYDTFLGGGMLGDMAKYNQLDKAGELMRQADAALSHFATELADVDIAGVGGIQITEMNRTFDVWFDNIFSDLAVRERINQAKQRVAQVSAAVGSTASHLRLRREIAVDSLDRLSTEREGLLTGSLPAGS